MQLATRLDFDGLVCAAMIYEMERIEEINFTNPKELEEGRMPFYFDYGDALAHLPFNANARLWFHNRDFESIPPQKLEGVRGKWAHANCVSTLVYEYYNKPELEKFKPLVDHADNLGAAILTKEDILDPKGWMMLCYTLDPRFAQDHGYGVEILTAIRTGKSPEEILQKEKVALRVSRYLEDEKRYRAELKQHTKMDGNVILTDFTDFTDAPRGNRFVAFLAYPDGNVQVRVDNDRDPMRLKVSVSKSIFNKTCGVNVGELMKEYSGGGVEGAGTCPIAARNKDKRVPEIIEKLKG
ncbi:MAG: hypothetical protein P9L92_15135 [Candidatus Electryonea clarkiae]|nr:hypothetical protein [Candidatus Electryonea clarkiae]MDP8288948.1 hypothetical protein [Candidatus Electryonea clarkiae]